MDMGVLQIMIQEMTVGQTVEEIKQLKARHNELEKSLVLRAQLQQVGGQQYNELVQIVREMEERASVSLVFFFFKIL
jgi:hypothetical protein